MEDNCARLEKIQGGINLINERLQHSNELQNERHGVIRQDIARLDAADALLDGRVVTLEMRDSEATGERKGVALSAKLLLVLCGAIPVGAGALLLRLLGA